MARIVVFGVRDTASLAHFYLSHDSGHQVVAFTVHRDYLPEEDRFEGLPVVPFEEVERHFHPAEHRFFAPMTATRMSKDRAAVMAAAEEKGYEFISYVSSKATTFPGVRIGRNCFILEDNTLQPFTSIGDDVVLWSGNHIGHHSVIRDHVFVTSHVVISGHCDVGDHAFLGVNATLRDNITIGEGTFVAMGACVTGDTKPWGVYRGVPARAARISSLGL